MLGVLFISDIGATPSLTGTSGTAGTDNSLTIFGSGFGTKSRSKLWLWADAQEGSLAPHSSLSDGTSFAETQNMTSLNDGNKRWGNGVFRSNWNYTSTQRAATLRPSNPTVTGSTRMFISWWEKSDINYLPTGTSENWKSGVRVWWNITGSGERNNHYFASVSVGQTVDQLRFTNEFPTVSSYMGSSYGFTNSTWRRIMAIYEMNSSAGSGDGSIKIYKNNTLVKNITGWSFTDSAHPNYPNQIFFQQVIANANVPSGQNFWLSDLAVEDSWGRVEIGDASTLAACTQLELQPYTSWSDNTITITQRLGTLSGSKWIYICDSDNNCNSSGLMLESVSVASPTITSIDPSNGNPFGGTSFTITGTNFVSTPTVTFGGNNATSITNPNSTTITGVTPAGTPLTSVDVVVTNPDLNSDTLTNGFTYNEFPAPEVTLLSPANGPSSGGTTITATGNYFQDTPIVTVNGVAATSETFNSSTEITFVTPAGTIGESVDVLIQNPDGQNYLVEDGFHYDPLVYTGGAFPWIRGN